MLLAPTMSPPEVIQFLRTSMDPCGHTSAQDYWSCSMAPADKVDLLDFTRLFKEACAEMKAALNSAACVGRIALHMKTHHETAKGGLTGKALLSLKLTGAKKETWERHPSELQSLIAVMLDVDEAKAPPEPPREKWYSGKYKMGYGKMKLGKWEILEWILEMEK